MKICVVGSSKKFYSGLSAYTTVMANALAMQNHQVSVILLRNLVPMFLYPGRDRVGRQNTITELRSDIDVYEGMDWNSPVSWIAGRRFLEKCEPDVIIMHWWTSSVAHMQLALAGSRRKMSRKPLLLMEMHEVVDPLEESILPIKLYSRIAGRRLVRLSDGYLVHSNETKAAVAKVYGIDSSKVFVVPHGPYDNYAIEARENARRDLNLEDGFTLLNFGMVRRYKGIPLLVEAFGLLPPDVARRSKLVIAGEDWGDDPGIGSAIERSPYRDRIIFKAEFVPDEKVGKYFAAADVVVLPYERTCGSGVVSIAMAQGKPVITSDLSTMRECMDGYEAGYFFGLNDVMGLRDQMLDAFNKWDRGELPPVTAAALGWDKIVARYEDVVTELRADQCV